MHDFVLLPSIIHTVWPGFFFVWMSPRNFAFKTAVLTFPNACVRFKKVWFSRPHAPRRHRLLLEIWAINVSRKWQFPANKTVTTAGRHTVVDGNKFADITQQHFHRHHHHHQCEPHYGGKWLVWRKIPKLGLTLMNGKTRKGGGAENAFVFVFCSTFWCFSSFTTRTARNSCTCVGERGKHQFPEKRENFPRGKKEVGRTPNVWTLFLFYGGEGCKRVVVVFFLKKML